MAVIAPSLELTYLVPCMLTVRILMAPCPASPWLSTLSTSSASSASSWRCSFIEAAAALSHPVFYEEFSVPKLGRIFLLENLWRDPTFSEYLVDFLAMWLRLAPSHLGLPWD